VRCGAVLLCCAAPRRAVLYLSRSFTVLTGATSRLNTNTNISFFVLGIPIFLQLALSSFEAVL
tara:strand:- start:2579 stop:2767 length:189 start_codon:yes stop_codon:yes gene_type:complete